jgi:hypothetical protein
MESHHIIHVAVVPATGLDSGQILAVASIINRSPPATRLLLAGRVPRIVAHYGALASAETAASALRDLGLRAMAFTDAELLRPSRIFTAHTLRFGDGYVQFRGKAERSVRIESLEASLIVRGTIETREHRAKTTTKMKLNLPMTFLTGGIPIRRRTTEKTVETLTKTEAFMRMYSKKPAEACVEVRQHEFDYSCLGSQMTLSSLTNFSNLVGRIRGELPQATYDDRLTKAFVVDMPFATPWEKIDILCNLIYLFENPLRGLTVPREIQQPRGNDTIDGAPY